MHIQKKPTGVLTSSANSCLFLRLRFPPKPLRRPTMNWPLSVTALRCDRPLKTVPTRLVSTTKSFWLKGEKKKRGYKHLNKNQQRCWNKWGEKQETPSTCYLTKQDVITGVNLSLSYNVSNYIHYNEPVILSVYVVRKSYILVPNIAMCWPTQKTLHPGQNLELKKECFKFSTMTQFDCFRASV